MGTQRQDLVWERCIVFHRDVLKKKVLLEERLKKNKNEKEASSLFSVYLLYIGSSLI